MREAYPEQVRRHRHPGMGFGAGLPEEVTPEFVRDEVAAGRARDRKPAVADQPRAMRR